MQHMKNLIKELEKLNENISFAEANHRYRLQMHGLYANFFALKKQGLPFAECSKVFDSLPDPVSEPELQAKKDVLASLFF